MRKPLILHQGGSDHLEHMIARLDGGLVTKEGDDG